MERLEDCHHGSSGRRHRHRGDVFRPAARPGAGRHRHNHHADAPPAGPGFPGFDRHFGSDIDYQALLAEALGITVEELQAAEQQAYSAALDQAVTNGDLTQDEADLMLAQQALKGYIDPEALQAKALGITVEELQAARDAGKSMSTLIDELGLTPAAVRTAQQAAYEEALARRSAMA